MKSSRRQMLRTLDTRLNKLRNAAAHGRLIPRAGWIATLRQGLGLTIGQLGSRLEITAQGVYKLEKAERKGTITLASLRRAAHAMDAELVYFIVPRNSVQDTIEQRARARSRKSISRRSRETCSLNDRP